MYSANPSLWWKRWIKPSRLVPLLTILGAGTAIILSLLGIIGLSVAENIILALLALLAIDALTERLSILEKIENKLSSLPSGQRLRTRDEIPSVETQATYASEICIIAISAVAVLPRNLPFFQKKVKSGCKIRVILLNPDSSSLQTFNLLDKGYTAKSDIERTLRLLKELAQIEWAKDKCEIRLSEVFLPFSMFAVDLQKESGSMVITYHDYRTASIFSERANIFLTQFDDAEWFNYYREQFENFWSDATLWLP
jgi:hypothetical protein